MKAVKCDICGKYVHVWHEVQNDTHKSSMFQMWKNSFDKEEIEDICLNCKEKLGQAIEATIKEIRGK
jgi:hypothetical protein